MSKNILKLKKNKDKTLERVKAQTEAMTAKKSYKDEREWQPLLDKSGSGFAIIRFLPGILIEGTDDEYEQPYVRLWEHGFQGPTNLWYIEKNRNTLMGGDNTGDGRDPVTEYNNKLWKTGDKELQEQARKQKRKLRYISNIYVVKHPARPEDEGKVFLYKYGQKIFEKINAKVSPSEEDMAVDPDLESVNVFDFWDGCNFRLKVKRVSNFPNYDDSSFDAPKALSDDDAMLETIFKQEHSLLAEVAADKFKSYEELKKRLYEVLDLDMDEEDEEEPATKPKVVERPKAKVEVTETEDEEPPFDVDEETGEVIEKPKATSSTSDFFKKLKTGKG